MKIHSFTNVTLSTLPKGHKPAKLPKPHQNQHINPSEINKCTNTTTTLNINDSPCWILSAPNKKKKVNSKQVHPKSFMERKGW